MTRNPGSDPSYFWMMFLGIVLIVIIFVVGLYINSN